MRYVLKDKIFSLGGDLTIQDDRGREVYFVDGKVLSLGRRLEIKDLKGNVVATIQQHLIALLPSYDIHLPNGVKVTMSKRISLVVDRLKIDVPGRDDLEVHGDLFHHEYTISRDGQDVATVSKRWVSLVDAYGVDIADDEDALLILASAVVIDELLDAQEHEHESE